MRLSKLRSGYACALVALILVCLAACGNNGGGGGIAAFSIAMLPPVADFSASPRLTDISTAVQFTDQSDYTPTTWAWDFNNDSVVDSTAQNPTHTYTAVGLYTVTLTVTNANGTDSRTRTNYIEVLTFVAAADIDADSNRDGTITAADDTNEDQWNATQGAVFYHNIDDDDTNNVEDGADTVSSGADIPDLAPFFIRQHTTPPAGGTARVTVSTPAQGKVRIFRKTAAYTQVYSTGPSFSVTYADLAAGDLEFAIEAYSRMTSTWNGHVTLTFELRNSGGTVVDSDAVAFRVAPPIMATNLWVTEEYNIVNITGGATENSALRTAMQAICTAGGITYREASGATYGGDRWLQDSSEFNVIQLPSATAARRVVPQVMQLARWRPCDDFSEDVLWGPDYDWFERFSTNQSSHNYGGNVEVVPPYTGKPYGRVMHGGGTGQLVGTTTTVTEGMVQVYRDFWDAAAIQGQFEITTEWLAVGHVDEYTAFVPAPNTARGWVVLIASPTVAVQVLQATQTAGQGGAAIFAGRTGHQTTVNAMLADTALMTLNNQTQARIDAGRAQLKAATNLTDADFIHLPILFDNVGQNYLAALNPGVVNMVTMLSSNGTVYFAIPDPEGPDIGGVDQWQQDILNKMNPLTNGGTPFDIDFVDVFWSYHDLLGEAHCGSNFTRTPPNDDWWNK